MIARLLACVVAQAVGMGSLHCFVGRRGRFPVVAFCAMSGGLAASLGLAAMLPRLMDQVRLAAWTAAWIPAFALGFFAGGVVLGAAWVALVHGGAMWLRSRIADRER